MIRDCRCPFCNTYLFLQMPVLQHVFVSRESQHWNCVPSSSKHANGQCLGRIEFLPLGDDDAEFESESFFVRKNEKFANSLYINTLYL